MRRLSRLLAVFALVLLVAITPTRGQVPVSAPPARPVEPIAAIVEAFKTHPLVALGEGSHGNEQGHRFRLALVRDPRFADSVTDIVVESGSARYQDEMDRFVRGEDVPYEMLRRAWEDTTQPTPLWDLPIYEEFFRTVRDVNASLPIARKLRVLLGDPPVDWTDVQSTRDLNKWGSRDSHAVELIRQHVLGRKRRALLIYGDDHFGRKSRSLAGTGDEPPPNIVGLIEKAQLASVFVVHSETRMDLAALQPDVKSWPIPSLAMLAGTALGAAEFEPSPRLRTRRMEELFDAVLYLGPPSSITFSMLAPERCRDAAYMEMRLGRLSMLGVPAQAPPGTPRPVDRLKDYCASLGR